MSKSLLPLYRSLLLFCILVLLGMTFWSGFSPTQPQVYAEESVPEALGSISGVVRNEAGEPLAGMQIDLYYPSFWDNNWSPRGQVTTDRSGRFRFAALIGGVYRLGATDPAALYSKTFYLNASNVFQATDVVANGSARTDVNLTLTAGGEITGLLQAADGRALENKVVTLSLFDSASGAENRWLQVDSQALDVDQDEFHFRGLASDHYRICATSYGRDYYWQECYNNVYAITNAQSISISAGTIVSNVVMLLGDGADLGEIRGQVTSPAAEPLANVGVYVVPLDAVIANPPLGTAATPPPPALEPVGRPLAAAALSATATVTPVMPAFLPNVPYRYYTSTASDGSYTVKNLFAGNYQIFFHDATGRYRYEYYDDVTYRSNALAVKLAHQGVITDINAQLALAAQLTGTITLFGQPAPLSTLSLYKQENSQWHVVTTATTDPLTGRYDMGGLPEGVYRLRVFTNINYSSFVSYGLEAFYGGNRWETATDIQLTTAEIKPNLDIDIEGGPRFDGAISGRVTANGTPLAGVKVSLYLYPTYCCNPLLLGRAWTYDLTDTDGRYRIDGLSYGTYFARFEDQSGLHASIFYPNQPVLDLTRAVITNDTETTADIDVDLPQAGMINGTVAALAGQALPSLTLLAVFITPDQTGFVYRETQLKGDGSFALQGLYPGTYHICAAIKTLDNNNFNRLDCYGGFGDFQSFTSGRAITVTAGDTVDNIDLSWGPDHKQYLPVVAK